MSNFASNRIILPLVTIGGLLLALMMGKWVAGGSLILPGLVIGGIFGAIFFLTLGRMYWYMIPFALASGLPAIPLGGRTIEFGELFVAVCTAIFVARVAMKKEHVVIFRLSHAPLLLCFAWICMVWAVHPTGLLFFGSEVMGGRYYLKVILAFFSFVIMASQEPTEKDFLRIIFLVFLGLLANMFLNIFSFFFLGGNVVDVTTTGVAEADGYSWQQVLAVPAITGVYYLFARYKPSEIIGFQRPWTIALFCCALGIGMMSGKRMGLFLMLVTPFLSAFVFREYKYMILAAVLAVAAGTVAVLGQGQLFELPFTAQRALSWLPGDWDPSLKQLGSSDIFREQLRALARDEIAKNPIVGAGYATSISDVMTGYNMQEFGSGVELEKVMGHAMSKNWHNAWLGYSADFGIPFTVFYVLLLATALFFSLRLARRLPHPSTRQIFCVYAFFSVCAKIITINTSGHTALDAFASWWLYGLLFAVAAQVAKENTEGKSVKRVNGDFDTTDQQVPSKSLGAASF